MTMKALQRRVEGIEARQQVNRPPAYLSVATADDIPDALSALDGAGSVKVYIGISPDDWDGVA